MNLFCEKVKKLDELLSDYLGTNKSIKNVNCQKMSKPGENYGSIIYKLDLTIENKDSNNEETINTIAKVLPEGEIVRQIFNIQKTYTNEMAFYKIIVPTLQEFQKELGIQNKIDCFAKCYAVRKNLKENSDIIDDDAVLILENLKILGYDTIDKIKGFDFETTKMIIRDLAQFHAIALAFKIKKPKIFEEKIMPYCHDHFVEGAPPLTEPLMKLVSQENQETANILVGIKGWEEIKRLPPKEPFATLIHDDLWTNNSMQKFENGKPMGNKLVDFQALCYGSPAIDLFFLLWTSVPLELLKNYLDYFIEYYHENFIETLKKHDINIAQFSFELFLKEIEFISPFEFKHAFFFILVAVHGRKGGFDLNKNPTAEQVFKTLSDAAKEKASYMVKECHNRGWIK